MKFQRCFRGEDFTTLLALVAMNFFIVSGNLRFDKDKVKSEASLILNQHCYRFDIFKIKATEFLMTSFTNIDVAKN